MSTGWIKLHRKFLEWEWYGCPKVTALFIHCILKANHKEKNWRGNTIPRGTFITSYNSLSEETGLSTRELRTAFGKLESTGEIDKRSTSVNSWVTVINYDDYQSSDKQETKERQARDKEATTTKNDNNEKNDKKNIPFDDFWDAYAKKKGSKKKCRKKWNNLSDDEREFIMEHIESYKNSFSEKQFQPYPHTFLNGKNWEAESYKRENNDNQETKIDWGL